MNSVYRRKHSVGTLFTIALFCLFFMFLLLLLVFSAQAYRSAAESKQRNDNLYTASAYLTAKFREHDSNEQINIQSIDLGANVPTSALCLTDTIHETDYITYIYLMDGHLRELFTAADQTPVFEMGTKIAALQNFALEKDPDGFLKITLEDLQGYQTYLNLHCGAPTSVSALRE